MSEYKQHGLARLEQCCIEPGYWRIEGYTVMRHPYPRQWWSIYHGDKSIAGFRTLQECREFLYERTHN